MSQLIKQHDWSQPWRQVSAKKLLKFEHGSYWKNPDLRAANTPSTQTLKSGAQ